MKDELIHEIQTKFPDLLAAILETMERTQYDGWPWTLNRLIEENPPLFKSLVENYRDNVRASSTPETMRIVNDGL